MKDISFDIFYERPKHYWKPILFVCVPSISLLILFLVFRNEVGLKLLANVCLILAIGIDLVGFLKLYNKSLKNRMLLLDAEGTISIENEGILLNERFISVSDIVSFSVLSLEDYLENFEKYQQVNPASLGEGFFGQIIQKNGDNFLFRFKLLYPARFKFIKGSLLSYHLNGIMSLEDLCKCLQIDSFQDRQDLKKKITKKRKGMPSLN